MATSSSLPGIATSSPTTFTTPSKPETIGKEDAISKDWADFSKEVDITPPAKISKSMTETIREANELLKEAGLTASWQTLTNWQKAAMAFLINEGLPAYFPSFADAASDVTRALFPCSDDDTICHDNLDNFVRRGGDKVFGRGTVRTADDSGMALYQAFISKHKIWRHDNPDSCTLFSLHPTLVPLLRFQHESSVACSAVAAAIIVYYCQHCQSSKKEALMQQGENGAVLLDGDSDAVEVLDGSVAAKLSAFAMNVSRFMRVRLTSEEKFLYIFKSRGFGIEDMLVRMLTPSNPSLRSNEFTDRQKIKLDMDLDHLHKKLNGYLQHGPLHTDRFKLYLEHGDSDTCEYHGHKTFTGDFHTITIVGAARTPERNGGILFIVQDSDCAQPFKNVGLDLLLEMGIQRLEYLDHDMNINFPVGGVFGMNPDFVGTNGGDSPFEPKAPTYDEWIKPAGQLEQWRYYTEPGYVPSWARS